MSTPTPSTSFPENLPLGWRAHLAQEAEKDYFKRLSDFLRQEYRAGHPIFPPRERILRALQTVDYQSVKVAILGQDPYHAQGQATGLSFAVPSGLAHKPPSLINIFKEIETGPGKKVDPTQSELSGW